MDEKELFKAYKKITLEYLKGNEINRENVGMILLAMHLVSTELLQSLHQVLSEREK